MKKLISLICALCLMTGCAGAFAEAGQIGSLTGIVIDAAMHTILLEAEDGERYYFHKEGDEDTSALTRGLSIGGALTLTYSGTINWDTQDTSGVKLLSIADGELNASINIVTRVEGEADVQTLAPYASEAGFATYYDADLIKAVILEDGADLFMPRDPNAIENVMLYGEQLGDMSLDDAIDYARTELGASGATIKTADTGALFAKYEVQGLEGETQDMYYALFAVRANALTYMFRLHCPIDALEGYGARLKSILMRTEFVNADGKADCSLYLPNDQADGFSKVSAKAAYTVQGLMDALYENGALPEPVLVISSAIDRGIMTVNFGRGYAQALSSTGTAGERMLAGSVVNTLIENFGVSSVQLLSCGAVIETGHAIYDEPLSMIED